VLYGDNAVGGTINIVTRTGVGGPPVRLRVESGFGSFNTRLGSVSTAVNSGGWSTSFYGNAIKSDGYRENNQYVQENGVGNLNYTSSDLTAFLTVTGDNQELRLPGGRTVDPSIGLDELSTDRRGAATPFNYANQQGASATAGFTKTLMNGVDLIVDGGVRDKKQQSAFFFTDTPTPGFSSSYVDAHLQTWSITPRLSIKGALFGMPLVAADRCRLLRCDLSTGPQRRSGFGGLPSLRPAAADRRRLFSAYDRGGANHRRLLRRARAERQPVGPRPL